LIETDFPEINPIETSFYEIAISWHVPNFINTIGTKRTSQPVWLMSGLGGKTGHQNAIFAFTINVGGTRRPAAENSGLYPNQPYLPGMAFT